PAPPAADPAPPPAIPATPAAPARATPTPAPPAAPARDPEPPSDPSPPPAAGDLTLDRIVAAWPDIVVVLSRQPAIKQLILTCRPVALDGTVVTLGYPEEQAFLRDVAERKKAGIETGIAEVIGQSVGVRCVVANIEVAPVPVAPDEDFVMAEARRIFGDDLVDVGEVN
ncbi:MAG: hypothetical protein WEG56_14100, partial [Chloroflexota bacterium]